MSFFIGLGIGLSLIIAIGAQNAFVLRQGVRRQHVFIVALICATSDAILISLGVAGVGVALESVPWLITVVRWGGVAFLVTYAVLALRRALRPADEGLHAAADEETATDSAPSTKTSGSTPSGTDGSAVSQPSGSAPRPTTTVARPRTAAGPKTLWATILATLAITWLNPHVYLDTMVFLGSVAQAQGEGRWLFAIGAFTGSFLWFFALAYGARYLGRWLSNPKAWRVLDGIIAVFMIVIALMLAFGF